MTVKQFFKQSDYQTQIQNKRDKEFHYFSYWDMLDFAEQYHEAKIKNELLSELKKETKNE